MGGTGGTGGAGWMGGMGWMGRTRKYFLKDSKVKPFAQLVVVMVVWGGGQVNPNILSYFYPWFPLELGSSGGFFFILLLLYSSNICVHLSHNLSICLVGFSVMAPHV